MLKYNSIIVLVFILAVRAQAQTAPPSAIDQLIQQRKTQYSKWHTGSKVPNIDLANGSKLYNLKARNIIILFWKTDCPYCEQLLPALNNLSQIYTKEELSIVAVCLDTDSTAWKSYTDSNVLSGLWYNKCDSLGFYGTDAINYNVYGTPALLLTNNAFTIKGNPKGIEQLKLLIEQD